MSICAFTHESTPPIPAAASPRTTWQAFDLADAGAICARLAAANPDVVVNTAATTNVDACERFRDEVLTANARRR